MTRPSTQMEPIPTEIGVPKSWEVLQNLSEHIGSKSMSESAFCHESGQKQFSLPTGDSDTIELLNIFESLRRLFDIEELEGEAITQDWETITSAFPEDKDESKFTFALKILSAINAEPVEDGFEHPAESLLKEAVMRYRRETVEWLYKLITEEDNAAFVASILKCLGRIEGDICEEWGVVLISKALQHRDVEVRDAAVQVAESWGTGGVLMLLKGHRDDVPWLQDYIDRVVRDLELWQKGNHGMAGQKNIESKMGT